MCGGQDLSNKFIQEETSWVQFSPNLPLQFQSDWNKSQPLQHTDNLAIDPKLYDCGSGTDCENDIEEHFSDGYPPNDCTLQTSWTHPTFLLPSSDAHYVNQYPTFHGRTCTLGVECPYWTAAVYYVAFLDT
nr:uncharacterized protein CTRU02_05434 [Colletotrichum truncatum]KAF6793877.1 hypothetical protein CTRU02_05434 [Colletotrichum truncatum]